MDAFFEKTLTAEHKAHAHYSWDGHHPEVHKKLAEAGVTSLKQIAEWTADDLKKYDEELALHGRAERDEWVQQAQDLLAGKPPRAKVDQEAAAAKAKK